ncbi:unnamed protein product [Leptosia nina]|uniref:C2H2-type domain-containing protein n=1 Tax=Leptosia nina TaxID=320188 RepID=A0AAV1JXN2_9NEOP
MKEININIEGYNVNGICVGCLNYNRKMFYKNSVIDVFKTIAEIDVPDGLAIQVCWECLATVNKIVKFKQQILKSYDILAAYSNIYPFLNNPSDLSQHASNILGTQTNASPTIDVEEKVEEQEIKEDSIKIELRPENLDVKDEPIDTAMDGLSSDDDMLLADLKREESEDKERKKVKRKRKKLVETGDSPKRNRLKNLPKGIVDVYVMNEEEMWATRERDVQSEEFSKMKYKCTDCVRSFISQKAMGFHFIGKHTPKEKHSIPCDVCNAYFLHQESLSLHRSLHYNAFICRVCGLVTTLKSLIAKHECAKAAKIHVCSLCNKSFSSKSKLIYHRSVCNEEKPQCDCCGKVFANKITLKSHINYMTGVLPKKKKKPTNVFIPCKGCDKVFQSLKSYRAHVVVHDGVNYPCPICGKLFRWKRNLARHTRNHKDKESGNAPQCKDCGKTFSSRDCYNNHMKLSKRHVHESALVHACQYCNKRFATKWCMVDHIDWDHLKRIKYRCRVCYKPFKTSKIMVAHMNNIHEGRNKQQELEGEHLCEVCGKSYKTVKRLKGHVWAMHTKRSDTKSFKCALCPATFSWQTSIYKHMRMMHGDKRAKQPRAPPPMKQESFPDVELATRMQYFPQSIGGLPPIQPINIVQNIV